MMLLNLGCGSNWKEAYPDYLGIDKVDYGQAYVHNILEGYPKGIENGLVLEVMANHFLEHLDQEQAVKLINETWEILADGGVFKICVPHKDKPKAWQLTHKTYYTEDTFTALLEPLPRKELNLKKWKIIFLTTNARLDIHCHLQKCK